MSTVFSGSIDDLSSLSQDPCHYLSGLEKVSIMSNREREASQASFEDSFFSPWFAADVSELDRNWGLDHLPDELWGSNLMPFPCSTREGIKKDSDMESFPSMNRMAIVVRNTSARFLPQAAPLFNDPSMAGEGYPFDLLQNTAYWAGTPVRVLHSNLTGDWLLCSSGSIPGWVPASDVAFMDEESVSSYRTGNYCSIVRDGVSVSTPDGVFLVKAHAGSVFPIRESSVDGFIPVLVPLRDNDGSAVFCDGVVSVDDGVHMPMVPSLASIAEMAGRMMGNPYGWGGLYEGRDCSSTLKDLFAPLGVWLPRDSGPQSRLEDYVDLAGFTPDEKLKAIAERAVPFRSIIGMAGHVVLFLGLKDGMPVVFHNLWGVRLRGAGPDDSGRLILGKTLITSLRPGAERCDVDPDWFISRIRTISPVI